MDALRIPLTRGYEAVIDADDLPLVDGYQWRAQVSDRSQTAYAVASVRGLTRATKRIVYMHHLILPPVDGLETDHRNNCGVDNRRENLRLCTHAQNCANRRNGRNKSGLVGVSKSNGKWVAQIAADGDKKNLGRFVDPVEAALAYDRAALASFGPFAVLNFPQQPTT